MNHKHKLLGYYNYTVVLTYIGMLFGYAGIVYAFAENIFSSIICLMGAGFCDMFDGTIASTKKDRTEQEKCFGIQIDSLSDLICFGVLPASIVYVLSNRNMFFTMLSGMYVLCALIRLAYFNVEEQERQKVSTTSRKMYYGMPVTLAAIFIPLVYGLVNACHLDSNHPYTITMVMMGILFLVPFPLKKPKMAGKICIVLCGLTEILLVVYAYLGMR